MRKKKQHAKSPQSKAQIVREANRIELWKSLLKAAPVMLLAVLLTIMFNRLDLFHKLETTVLDTQMRLNTPPVKREVAIVNITGEDYENIFDGRSPLKVAKLQELINGVALGKPKVIGVDINTSDPSFNELKIGPHWPPVIWAREVLYPNDENKREALDVLGGQDPALNDNSGLPLLIDAPCKVTRGYRRFIKVRDEHLPSFAWALVSKSPTDEIKELVGWCRGDDEPGVEHDERCSEALLIGYTGDNWGSPRYKIPASQVLAIAESEGWQNDSPIKDKIVLIGGSYLDQDRHDTPLGEMVGVEILANVIETELRGGGLKPPGWFALALVVLLEGVALVLLFHILPFGKALWVGLLAIPIISLLGSLISFRSFAYWAYFAPVLLGILIFELMDHANNYRKGLIKEGYEKISETLHGNYSSAKIRHTNNTGR